MNSEFITQEMLAKRWLISTATLERERSMKKGVKYLRIGGLIRYRMEDVIAFENSCEVETNSRNKNGGTA